MGTRRLLQKQIFASILEQEDEYEGSSTGTTLPIWLSFGLNWKCKLRTVLGSCGELDDFVSIPDEGVTAFLRKKVKSGATVGKRVLLQVIEAKDLELGTRRKLRSRMTFVKTNEFHSSETMLLYLVEHLYLVSLMLGTTLAL
ncbi:hypothetical protein Tco_1043293 [Tanacetum coccineum]|uniref:Uncharacterized protein n=1 Tax=Tanacetum coccineum TaxID=301880 RepID=A0ABQ5GP77_9ASTR